MMVMAVVMMPHFSDALHGSRIPIIITSLDFYHFPGSKGKNYPPPLSFFLCHEIFLFVYLFLLFLSLFWQMKKQKM